MDQATWQSYVCRLCDGWDLDALATDKLLTRLEALDAAGKVTDRAVAQVLYRAGVARSPADLIAPSIRVAMTI